MPSFSIIKKSNSIQTFRTKSVCGRFDIKSNKIEEKFNGKISLPENWKIGIICGTSGTGKSTIINHIWPNKIKKYTYSKNAVIDDMPKHSTNDDIYKAFCSVGFSSPPNWLKPQNVLSNGEKMRVDLARVLLDKDDLFVFDEYTSVVDRDVAKIGSMALSKAIKRSNKKFIAVSCHFDIISWLNPDWVFNTNEMETVFPRGKLCRPEIKIEIRKQKGFWSVFRKYHYLNHELKKGSDEYVGFYNSKPICFCAIIHFPHPKFKNGKTIHRLVVLPDYQGVGLGIKFLNSILKKYKNKKIFLNTSHPSMIKSLNKNQLWKLQRYSRVTKNKTSIKAMILSFKRKTASFLFKPLK